MKKRILFYLRIITYRIFGIILLLPFSSTLRANLDGQAAPIYLDTPYSFANGEWARGSVFFRQGFDLPVGGTVYLGIDGGFVNGPINLNGGTLIFEKHIILKNRATIVAPGFMSGTPSVPSSTYVKYEGRDVWGGAGKIKFIRTDMIFQAICDSAAIDNKNVTIDAREGGQVAFLGGKVILRNWLTNESNPYRFFFFNADVIVTNDFSNFNSGAIVFAGDVLFTALHPLDLKNVYLQTATKVTIFPGANLSLKQLNMPILGTRFELRMSSLDFMSTSTGFIRVITPYVHNNQGTVAIEGRCNFSSSTNNTLIFDRYAKLELLAGAHLKLKEGTHLLVE